MMTSLGRGRGRATRAIVVSVAAAMVWLGTAAGACAAKDYVWWEGEQAAETNFPAKSWFDASTFPQTADLLSGGQWLSVSGKRGKDELFARYRVEVLTAKEYTLWVRKFWKHGPFRWRFDQGPWQECGRNVALADNTFLKENVGANWVELGKVKPGTGKHVFEIRLLAKEGEDTAACFDAFLLAPGPFMPRGKLKPDERSGQADQGFFAWEPAVDGFGAEAMLDLRSLNEKEAGERGFVRREGGRFVLGSGEPVRFWGVNVGPNNIEQSHAMVDYMARRLAKLGVNVVRCHGPLFDQGSDPSKIDAERLDRLQYLVTALGREGIYTEISFFFPLWADVGPKWGIDGYENWKEKHPFAILYFDKRMQEIHRSWLKAILTTPNPYAAGKRPLGRDPAVAIVEIVNEDSLFFWTFSKKNVPPVQWERLEKLFGAWLAKRYGSIDKATAAWGGAKDKGDDAAAGRMTIVEAWGMTTEGLKGANEARRRRAGDQVRFLAELQRGFYADTVRYIKEDLKAGCLVSASNWTTADADLLDGLERWTYTAADVVDMHGYFGGKHEGQGAGYSVRVGHTFENLAAVTVPQRLPVGAFVVADRPQTITEIGWTPPNRYRSDATTLEAVYGALQDVDGVFWFAVGSDLLADTTLNKFPVCTPVTVGTLPATALIYRKGYVAEAPVVVEQTNSLEDLFAMKGSGAPLAAALDALRAADVPEGMEAPTWRKKPGIDPLAFYVGRVERGFGDKGAVQIDKKLATLIDYAAGTVRSVTGELAWDWKSGLVRVDAPRAQGATGFLAKTGRVELRDVVVESKNEYGSVLVVPLDGRAIGESRRVLVQVMTEEQPYGYRVEGNRIAALGGWPFGVRKVEATVTLKWKEGAARVTTLDENGYARGAARAVERGADGVAVKVAEDGVWTVVER